jgi:uncharacterized protein YkwD
VSSGRTEFAEQSIDLVNQARRRARLSLLTSDPVLGQVAQAYSARMAREGFYGHADPQGRQVTDRLNAAGYLAQRSAENIARGQPDPVTVVEGWLASPGHRANILTPELTRLGAGYAFTATPPYHHYWTHVFATPDASVGRNQADYPAQALTLLNQGRQRAGVAALAASPQLTALAQQRLGGLAQARSFRSQAQATLQAVSRAALGSHRHAVAQTAAGAATPEEAVAQWQQGRGAAQLHDAALRAAGIAYRFVAQDEYRHYWLLVLAD